MRSLAVAVAVALVAVAGCSSDDPGIGSAAGAQGSAEAGADASKDAPLIKDGAVDAKADAACTDMTIGYGYSGGYVCDDIAVPCTQPPGCQFSLTIKFTSYCPSTCNHTETFDGCTCQNGIARCNPYFPAGTTLGACCDCPPPPHYDAGIDGDAEPDDAADAGADEDDAEAGADDAGADVTELDAAPAD